MILLHGHAHVDTLRTKQKIQQLFSYHCFLFSPLPLRIPWGKRIHQAIIMSTRGKRVRVNNKNDDDSEGKSEDEVDYCRRCDFLFDTFRNDDDNRCSKCQEQLYDFPFFDLINSERNNCHKVCAECLGVLHTQRGCKLFFSCPSINCQSKIVGHQCVKRCTRAMRLKGLQLTSFRERQPAQFIENNYDQTRDPIRCYINNPDNATNILLTAT